MLMIFVPEELNLRLKLKKLALTYLLIYQNGELLYVNSIS